MSLFANRTIRSSFAVQFFAVAAVALTAANACASELVMFERDGCPYCARWDAEVAPAYMKTVEGLRAPLRRYNIGLGQPKDIVLERPVRYTPTFVLVDDGREVSRITGYVENGMFWGLLQPMIAKLGDARPVDSTAVPEKQK